MRYASALASLNFLFPTGTLWALGDFLGGPSCGLRMLFYWICPLVTPTPCRHWGIFWEGHHVTSGCCSIGYASSHSHSHITSAWFASSPLPPPFTYPFHTTRSGSARSHQALKASTHYFGLGLLLPLSTATCSFAHPPPTGFFHNTWLAGCMYGSFGCS